MEIKKIKRIYKNGTVRIPIGILEQLDLKEDDKVEIVMNADGYAIIRKAAVLPEQKKAA